MPTRRSASPPTPAPCSTPSASAPVRLTASVPHGNALADARGDRAVEQEARDGARAAEQPDADHDERRHAASRARRTRLVVSATASKPGGHAGRGVAGREAAVAVVEHLQQLELHGRERRQRAAEPGAEERPPVGRQRQALLQARREVAERERPDDVRDERRPRPLAGRGRQRLDEPEARERADEAAGEDRRELAAINPHRHRPGRRRRRASTAGTTASTAPAARPATVVPALVVAASSTSAPAASPTPASAPRPASQPTSASASISPSAGRVSAALGQRARRPAARRPTAAPRPPRRPGRARPRRRRPARRARRLSAAGWRTASSASPTALSTTPAPVGCR